MRSSRWLLVAIAVFALCQVASADLSFTPDITITDVNSTVGFQTGSSENPFIQWIVDGYRLMYNQAFFYRIGSEGGERNVNTLTLDPDSGNLSPRIAEIIYAGNGLKIDIVFTLTGGEIGSGQSDLAESIRVKNTNTTGSLDLHFYQFVNFDLSPGTGEGGRSDVVWLANANTMDQTGTMGRVAETVVTPSANRYQVGPGNACAFGFPLSWCADTTPTILSNFGGPLGPADVAWAFQWDATLGAGQSLIISKDKRLSIVPEPASILGLGTVLFLVGYRLRRKKA